MVDRIVITFIERRFVGSFVGGRTRVAAFRYPAVILKAHPFLDPALPKVAEVEDGLEEVSIRAGLVVVFPVP